MIKVDRGVGADVTGDGLSRQGRQVLCRESHLQALHRCRRQTMRHGGLVHAGAWQSSVQP